MTLVDGGVKCRAFSELRGVERDERLLSAARSMRWAVADMSRMIAEVEANKSYVEDGFRSLRGWVQAVTNSSKADAQVMVNRARVLDVTPEVAGELYDGSLGVSQVDEIVKLARNAKCREALAGQGQYLAAYWGERLVFDDFVTWCAHFRAVLDPDDEQRRHEAAHARRRVSTSQVDEQFSMYVQSDSLDGAEIMEVLSRFEQAEFEADCAELRERCGENAPMALLRRTGQQRRMDALMQIFRTAAAANVVSVAEGPLVNLVTDPETFAKTVDRFLGFDRANGPSGEPAPDPRDMTRDELHRLVRTYRADTSSGASVDPRLIIAAALSGQMRRIVVDSAGVVIDAGRRQRFFTGALREVVHTMGGRCFWPGCDVSAGRCEVDHVTSWPEPGGETRAANAALACGFHNRFKQHGFRVWRDPEGQWHTYRPDGTEITPLRRPEYDPDW